MNEEKYSLVGIDGNAYYIMGYVASCMKKEGKTQEEINTYLEDAKSSNYDYLVTVSFEMIDKLNK